MATTLVVNEPDQERFAVYVDAELAGFVQYRLRPGLIAFIHTEIDDRFEGQGLGSQLVRGALDEIRTRGGVAVLPFCPFVNGWIQQHAEYADLVPAEYREQFGL